MAIGIITVAVITAQVASAFVDQAARRRAATAAPGDTAAAVEDDAPATTETDVATATRPDSSVVTLADLDQRLARIEQLVTALAGPSGQEAGGPE